MCENYNIICHRLPVFCAARALSHLVCYDKNLDQSLQVGTVGISRSVGGSIGQSVGRQAGRDGGRVGRSDGWRFFVNITTWP